MHHEALLILLIFLTAALYSTVGHAGASGYLAAMALCGLAQNVMRPAALVLNILVATIATVRFARAGCFSWRIFLPFALLSIPCAYLGGKYTLPAHIYKQLVGAVLLYAAFRLLRHATTAQAVPTKPPAAIVALPVGAALGLLSGLTGVGGGIFLSPLLMLKNWADPRTTAGVSAAFILINSISGLAGQMKEALALPSTVALWAVAAVVGGAIGSHLGARKLAGPTIRRLLAVVLVLAGFKMILT